MGDETMSDFTQEILALDLGIQPYEQRVHTVGSNASTNMKPGMWVTNFGETGKDIDILTKEDEYALGVVLRRKNRKISADGAVEDDVDTAFAVSDEVIVQYMTGGRAWVWTWLTGLETAAARALMRRGAEVFILQEDGSVLDADNATLGAGLCFVKGSLNLATVTGNQHLVKIGTLVNDVTIADSTSAAEGRIAKVSI